MGLRRAVMYELADALDRIRLQEERTQNLSEMLKILVESHKELEAKVQDMGNTLIQTEGTRRER